MVWKEALKIRAWGMRQREGGGGLFLSYSEGVLYTEIIKCPTLFSKKG